MQAKQIGKWRPPFSMDGRSRREVESLKARVKEVTGEFLGMSVILRRALSLYSDQVDLMSDSELRHEVTALRVCGEGRE